MRKIILMMLLAIMNSSAMAMNCEDDIIRTVSPDGSVLIMLSGAVYNVDAVDHVYTQAWQGADNVLICMNASQIINKDEGEQKVSVKRIN